MKAFIYLLLIALGTAQICPPPEVLDPCTCDEDFSQISCRKIWGNLNLKEIFDNASSFVNDDVIFDRLSISLTSLVQIGEGTVEHLKFREIGINFNERLEYISPGAFNASRNVTRRLELWYNRINNDPPRERDIFNFVGSFPNLEAIALDGNEISSIPDHAFQNLPSLAAIFLYNNNISHIGSHAFATGGKPDLMNILLQRNSIPSEGLPEDAFAGIGTNFPSVYMQLNGMDFMEQKSFQTLLDKAANVTVGGASCVEKDCIYERLYCDERADWICDNVGKYRRRLYGFSCKPGAGVEDIWEYCAKKNETNYGIYLDAE